MTIESYMVFERVLYSPLKNFQPLQSVIDAPPPGHMTPFLALGRQLTFMANCQMPCKYVIAI